MYISSPLEQFEIHNYWNILGLHLSNFSIYLLIIFTLMIILHKVGNQRMKLISNRWNISQESLYWTVETMVEQQIGAKGRVYFPFIYVLFVFILIANLLGNIPYSFAITSHLILTIGMSVMILIGVTILGFKHHQLEFFSLFCPVGTPLALVPLLVLIEVVSYLARSVSLGLRLGANIMAGHMLMIILGGFIYQIFMMTILGGIIPFIIVIGITGLELAISIIQSYVFVILTCSYIKDAIELH